MKKISSVALVLFCVFFGAASAMAQEKLVLSTPLDEMPSQIQDSDTFVKQLYVQEKRSFDQKISQAKKQNQKVPLYRYKKLAPSANEQKSGIEIIQ